MAIDKIKLRHLAKDKDVRLFEEGDMLDALNITVDANSESSGDLVKNVKSTLRGTAATASDQLPNEDCRVVGSVSDDANGKVYFFVWSASAGNHGVYEYNAVANTYQVVLKNSLFSFQRFGFVNAVLLRGEFETDSRPQTILYFTDNVNPPRKINVTRFLDPSFNVSLFSNQEVFEMISAAKTPFLMPPYISLLTDDTKTENNLYGKAFQFAVQAEYLDGELSAVSPHSKIVYSKYMAIQGVDQTTTDLGALREDNLALIDTRWNSLPSDFSYFKAGVSKIRILVRENNVGPFYLVDSFNPEENLIKNGNTLYTASDGVYKFYNNGLNEIVSVSQTDKIYDDVPQIAASQAIAGNRLMYSSPTSGYPNVDVSATISVNYLPSPTAVYATSSEENVNVLSITSYPYLSSGSITIDYSSVPESVSAGSVITIEFDYKPSDITTYGYNVGPGDFPLLKLNFGETPYENDVTYYAGMADDSQNGDYDGAAHFNFSTHTSQANTRAGNLNWARFRASVTTSIVLTKDQAMALLAEEMEEQVLNFGYQSPSETLLLDLKEQNEDGTYTDVGHIEYGLLTFDLAFAVSQANASDILVISPKIGNFHIPSQALSESNGFLTTPNITFPAAPSGLNYFNGIEDNTSVFDFVLTNSDAYEKNGIYFNGSGTNLINAYTYGFYVQGYNNNYDVVNGFRESALTIHPTDAIRTFKAGCDHSFGVVYFDRHGRPGYVNEIGTVSVAPFGNVLARQNPSNTAEYFNGPCEVAIDFNSSPPLWATSYQIVYSEMLTWEKFESYSVGGGFYKEDSDNEIYVSLNTLEKYQREKGAIKDYTFTAGDKLRVISYVSEYDDTELTYLSDPSDYTFDIASYNTEVVDIVDSTHDSGHTNHTGKFLVLPLPFGNQPLNFTPGNASNFWRNECVVEILSPKETNKNIVYYEIGESKRILKTTELTASGNDRHNDSQPLVTNEGSVHFKPISCAVPKFSLDDGSISVGAPMVWQTAKVDSVSGGPGFVFETKMLESSSISDFLDSESWSKGRAHVVYDKADTINYYNRITYSGEYGEDLDRLTFSNFNPGAFSYKNLPKIFGSVNFIGNYNQGLVALQENKMCVVPVNRNIIEYADSSSNLTVGKEVLGPHQEANGDFGIGNDASSVLVKDGVVFFVDRSRQKIIASGGTEMKVISDIDMSSFFEAQMNSLASIANGGRIVSGFDPQEDMYYVTFEGVGTAGYSLPRKRWISRYSFTPSNYASIDNSMISGFKKAIGETPVNYLFHKHSAGSSRNNFYGVGYSSEVQVVSKISPSEVKVFNALSYEGNSDQWTVDDPVLTDLHQESGLISSFKEKEGAYYASMPRVVGNTKGLFPVNGAYDGGTSQYLLLGHVQSYETSGNGHIVTFDNRLSRIPMPSMSTGTPLVSYLHSGEIQGAVGLNSLGNAYMSSYDLENNTITISGSNVSPNQWSSLAFVDNAGNGQPLYLVLNAEANGDPIRGRWAKIRLTNDNAGPQELYCINTHISKSKTHHVLGQE